MSGMDWAGVWWTVGLVVVSVGIGLNDGLAMGLTTLGIGMMATAVFGEWNDGR